MCNYRKEYSEIAMRIPASTIRHRKEFNLAQKECTETLEDWYIRLRGLAEKCAYDCHLDAFLLHQFVCGLDESILEQLSMEDCDLSFLDIMNLIRNYETSKEPVVIKPEIKQEEPLSSDGERYNDNNSFDSGDENEAREASYDDNIQIVLLTFTMEQTLIESKPNQQSFQLQLPQPTTNSTKLFECYLCHKTCTNVGQLMYHFVHYHTTGKTATCQLCGRFIKNTSSMMRQLNYHFSIKQYTCDICDLSFSRSISLKKHLLKHKKPNAKSFNCLDCEKTFLTKQHLKTHYALHNKRAVTLGEKLDKVIEKHKSLKAESKVTADKNSVKCEICLTTFKDEGAREIHMKVHLETEWLCHLCGRKMKNKRNLTHHYRIHSNERPFKCNDCNKDFASKDKLKLHSRTHTGERPYVCSLCNKSFLQKGHLVSHVLGHSKFQCDKCSRAFLNEDKYKQHMHKHTLLKPHVCMTCKKAFKHKCALTEHERLHTGEKPHECSICQKRFTHSSTLRGHLKMHA